MATLSDPTEDITRWLGQRSFADCQHEFDEHGYIIFENVLDTDDLASLKAALAPFFDEEIAGRNDFEGLKSNRIYALLAKSPIFASLVIHPLALAFAEADLGPSCLLSACLAIRLHPGETVQPWHHDDQHMLAPMPRPSWGVSTFWALDDTTETNGATEILPGSHRWNASQIADQIRGMTTGDVFADTTIRNVDDDPGAHPDAIKATMPAGSLMVAKGTLLHRGGANRSNAARTIITPQYCVGWARQLENMIAVVPRSAAAQMPKRARELIGYSIHPPFMGYTDGVHPDKLLAL